VMKDGVIQQYDAPQQTYDHPANQFVAGFIGSPAMNFLSATAAREGDRIVLTGSGFRIAIPGERSSDSLPERVVIGIRPEDLDGPTDVQENSIRMKVSVKEQLGHSLLVYGHLEESQVVASLDPHRQVDVDATIGLSVNLRTLHVFDPETLGTLL